jgi:homoisocitrate dehydrogenase
LSICIRADFGISRLVEEAKVLELCVIEGDGVGHEVIPAALRILEVVLPEIKTHSAQAGWECFQACGTSLPDETIELAKTCRAVIFGAAASPSYSVEGYFSPILQLRRELDTFANLRPTRYLPVVTARPGVNLLVVRENTEDLYTGSETTSASGDTSIARKVITRRATERVAHSAYKLARLAGRSPTRFDVILTSNLYGDILSDMAAAWGGGLGLAPALNIGDEMGIAEPVHGSAADISGKGIANPIAAILSLAMLTRYHWEMPDVAQHIEKAVCATLEAGDYTEDIYAEGAISTVEITDRVCQHLG